MGQKYNLSGALDTATVSLEGFWREFRLQQSLSQQQQQAGHRDLERIYGKADPLAALIPGNSVAEQVLTSGFSSTL